MITAFAALRFLLELQIKRHWQWHFRSTINTV
jgi:hypothetical protein